MVSIPEPSRIRSLPLVPVNFPDPLTMFVRFKLVQALGLTWFAEAKDDCTLKLVFEIEMPAVNAVSALIKTNKTKQKTSS